MSRKTEATEYIRNAILSGEISQDDPISELAISEKLGMSRSPIREALQQLEGEGLVVSYPNRGSFVAPITPYDVDEIYDLRRLLEIGALNKSFNQITEQEIDKIESSLKKGHEASDWKLLHEADRELHQLIINKCGNKRLKMFYNTLNLQVERVRRVSAKDIKRYELSYKEHMEILKYMRSGNLDKCRESLETHLKSVSDSAVDVARVSETI